MFLVQLRHIATLSLSGSVASSGSCCRSRATLLTRLTPPVFRDRCRTITNSVSKGGSDGNEHTSSTSSSSSSSNRQRLPIGAKQRLFGIDYTVDEWTNLTDNIRQKLDRRLLHTRNHPLHHLAAKIRHFFYSTYMSRSGSPLFSVYDNFAPVVTVEQNFDSLLTPKDHVSRSRHDCFYVDRHHLLRSHTTCHDNELIRAGLNAYLTFGDVYRRDEIDAKHYPVFHQCDAVRLFTRDDLFKQAATELELFELNAAEMRETGEKQAVYTLDACKIVEYDLKNCLTQLVQFIFGSSSEIQLKWSESTFPFTHPSWELEIEYKGVWYEVLGCGLLRQDILKNAGANEHIGWAFGLGLERWAMILYDIPDIRIFWSTDAGFLSQFQFDDPTFTKSVKYKPVSAFPACSNDISFWLPELTPPAATASTSAELDATQPPPPPPPPSSFSSNDFYDLVRDTCGDLVEQVQLVDQFVNPKTKRTSHCYRIVYRSMERTMTQAEVNQLHKRVEQLAVERLHVKIR